MATLALFEVDPERKRRLLQGLDDIGLTLQYKDDIKSFEEKILKKNILGYDR